MFLIHMVLISPLAAQTSNPSSLVKADFVIIEKPARTLKLRRGDEVLKANTLSSQPVGAKEREEDHKVAEGQIHGMGKNCGWIGSMHKQIDWTDGCVAVTNSETEKSGSWLLSGRVWRSDPECEP